MGLEAASSAVGADAGVFELLVRSVKDYAIFLLDLDGKRRELERGGAEVQGLSGRRSHRDKLRTLLLARGRGGRASRA